MSGLPQEVSDKLSKFGQQHLVQWWDELNDERRNRLLSQIEAIDLAQIQRLTNEWRNESKSTANSGITQSQVAPPKELVRLPKSESDHADWRAAAECGTELLNAGKVGVILVAGGQGTRLGFHHPKGMFSIGPVTDRTLFQILAEQSLARSRMSGKPIPYYVMTSEATHAETVAFFEQHSYFGMNSDDVSFFQQGTMPAVDPRTGRILMTAKYKIASGPDGHGGLLAALSNADLIDDMRHRGVEYLFYHQVDNPSVKVCDPTFLGLHKLRESEMSTKVVAKRSADEKVGLLVDIDGKTQIIEYSDLPENLAYKRDNYGDLLLWAGNIAVHILNRSFIERLRLELDGLPFHLVKRVVAHIDATGEMATIQQPNAVRFERFIFDALPYAKNAMVVETSRADEFNPVKNQNGEDSPETARRALNAMYLSWLREVGAEVSEGIPAEISPLTAIDADQLAEKIESGARFTEPIVK